MVFFRINLIVMLVLISVAMAWGESQDYDIESRFIDSDYSRRISMDFKDASLIDILKIFSKESGKNFITAQDVSSKKITVYLDNIPIEEALDKILETNELTYEMVANSDIFVVKTKLKEKTITKVFPLKYASVDSSKINSSSGSGGSATKGGLVAAVKGALSKDGKLEEDARTNSLIVRDVPDQFLLIEETIAKLDIPVLQVLIEVEMLDVSKSSADQIGISYGNGGPFITVKGSSRSSTFPFDEHMIANKSGENPVSWTTASSGYDFSGMSAALDFLRSQSDTRSLARPRLITLNNETAKIEITTDEAIGLSAVTTSTSSSSAQTVATAERTKTGVSLEVTPQANLSTNEILMTVIPKVTAASQSVTFGGTTFKNPEEQGSQSILKVKNGETIVLGGLLRTQKANEISKLPILGDLPLMGGVFRHTKKTVSERELIIFITPYILDEKAQQKMNSESKIRLNREIGVNKGMKALKN